MLTRFRMVNRWLSQMASPVMAIKGLSAFPRYLFDWRQYRRLPGAERLRLIDTHPQLHDRTSTTSVDTHYFNVNGWAMRRVVAQSPNLHLDVGSQTMFVNLLSAVV